MLTYSTSEVEECEILHPVVVVYHLCCVRAFSIEVEELSYLLLDAFLIVVESLGIEEVTLLRFARRVTNHTCGAANKDDRLVSATLEMTEHHDAAEVTYMERICGRVSAKVSSDHLFLKKFLGSWHYLCQHTAPFQFFDKVLHYLCCLDVCLLLMGDISWRRG